MLVAGMLVAGMQVSNIVIFHSSFFIEFCEAKFLWASRFGACAPEVRVAPRVGLSAPSPASPLRGFAGGSASIPLAQCH
jgi:hypothetical protein